MPTLSDIPARHVIIDKRDDEYIAFPDVIRAGNRLIVAYNEADKHVQPTRRTLLVKTSDDNGRTWSDLTRMDSLRSHCPRLARLASGEVFLSDSSGIFFDSADNGQTWETRPVTGWGHDMVDKVLQLDTDTFLTTGHTHRGESHPAIGQVPSEQMVYRSDDRCASWTPISELTRHRNLVLCEASMLKLPDGRIAALMRENSFVYEPMYLCLSEDHGAHWSEPIPTPLIGHRPTMGLTQDGRLLVTYRNVAPDPGTCAWLGTLDELTSDFRVQGCAPDPANPTLTPDGLRVCNDAGPNSVVRYALRPISDPRTATATLEVEITVHAAEKNGCAIRFGGLWWRLFPGCIDPALKDCDPIPIEPGRIVLRFTYAEGLVTLFVNSRKQTEIMADDDHAETRPILIGTPFPFEDNAVDCAWHRIHLDIDDPAFQRTYAWDWQPTDGLPDQWAQDNILELKNARHAASPDFGYSGWTTLADGSFFCTYHHAHNAEDYEPLYTSHIQGTWFSVDDFK